MADGIDVPLALPEANGNATKALYGEAQALKERLSGLLQSFQREHSSQRSAAATISISLTRYNRFLRGIELPTKAEAMRLDRFFNLNGTLATALTSINAKRRNNSHASFSIRSIRVISLAAYAAREPQQ